MVANLASLLLSAPLLGVGIYMGLVLYALALLLFWSAVRINRKAPLSIAFAELSPSHVVVEGPYRYIRHPFYTSYLLAWVAGALTTGHVGIWLLAAIMGGFYYWAAALEETWFAQSERAESYAAYRRKTGMFLPRLAKRSL